ncbi:DUF4393 domain-containing protein [Actinobacillus equuli subsp. haemolyticus]|uniref:DUF4393 domain-containing protein n=1 Tax=Actinobacillus equuli TaxID=718 RepID=UPI002441EC0B|nr:DUF4393 domain-containing protein [Actinobacillus equuli]WGE64026.1 DUF4393 domain-containing protein [Actinobacillus equuli subsp. haemolyticus]
MSEPLSTIATGIATAAGKEITTTASKGIGQTMSDIWYVVFGAKWDEKRQKKQIEVANNVDKFKGEITNKSAQIPEGNRIDPDPDVIGSTLESARFRINKDKIRDMFSNLIVSAMDSSKADDIHPSFSEMIKMLSPLDAQNLYYLFRNNDETIANIKILIESDGYITKVRHFYLGNPECQDNNFIEPSIDNLIRLKLVDVTYDETKTNDSLYDKYLSHQTFLMVKQEVEIKIEDDKKDIEILGNKAILSITDPTGKLLSESERLELKESIQNNLFKGVELQKGIIRLTALGRNFCKVCL